MTHTTKQWFDMQLSDQIVAERNTWLQQANDWEAAGKPITRKQAVFLLRDVLTFEEVKEIMAGTSPILNDFTVIDEVEATTK